MGFLSAIENFVRATAEAVHRAVSAVARTVRDVAVTALIFMGESGEAIVDGVKGIWRVARPFVDATRGALRYISKNVSIDWIATVAYGLERTLAALTAFERSPVAKVIDAALRWMIIKGKELRERLREKDFIDVTPVEAKDAENHGIHLRRVLDDVPSESRHEVEATIMFTDLYAVSGQLNELLENGEAANNFDLYLRVRATQKLIKGLYQKVAAGNAQTDDDDHFLARIAKEIIDNGAELSSEAAERLDAILSKRTGHRLDSFVLEELSPLFNARHKELDKQWAAEERHLGRTVAQIKMLEKSKEDAFDNKLSESEEELLSKLQDERFALNLTLQQTGRRRNLAEACSGAAEGLVQLLETDVDRKSEAELNFLQSEINYLSPLLRNCFEQPDAWETFSLEQRSRLTEYALRHFEAMKRRILALQS